MRYVCAISHKKDAEILWSNFGFLQKNFVKSLENWFFSNDFTRKLNLDGFETICRKFREIKNQNNSMNVQLQDYLTKKVVNIAEGVVLTEKLSHLIFFCLVTFFF